MVPWYRTMLHSTVRYQETQPWYRSVPTLLYRTAPYFANTDCDCRRRQAASGSYQELRKPDRKISSWSWNRRRGKDGHNSME